MISLPRELITCPISGCIFKDPVTLPEDGHTYEKSEILKWLVSHDTSPITRVPICTHNPISVNHVIQQLVDIYLASHPEEVSSQFQLFQTPANAHVYIRTERSALIGIPIPDTCKIWMDTAVENLTPMLDVRPMVKVFGKDCHQNRNVKFFTNEIIQGYAFSGQVSESNPMTRELELLLNWVNTTLVKMGIDMNISAPTTPKFNGILINQYTCGTDYISKHSDTGVPVLPLWDAGVAMLSHGVPRTFRIREKTVSATKVLDLKTNSDELILMCGEFQREFTHEIPIEKKVQGVRTSFTFRSHRH